MNGIIFNMDKIKNQIKVNKFWPTCAPSPEPSKNSSKYREKNDDYLNKIQTNYAIYKSPKKR